MVTQKKILPRKKKYSWPLFYSMRTDGEAKSQTLFATHILKTTRRQVRNESIKLEFLTVFHLEADMVDFWFGNGMVLYLLCFDAVLWAIIGGRGL
jgi:hypothetical protein